MEQRTRLTFTTIMMVFLSMLLCVHAHSADKKIFKWRAQGYAQPGSLGFKIAEEAFQNLKEVTDGRLDIQLYGGGALVGPVEAIDAIGKGIFEVGLNAPGYYAGKDPAFSALYSMAGVWPDSTHAKIWLYYFGGNELAEKLYAKYNLHYVGPLITSPECLLSNKPITKLEDLKGLKVRTTPGLPSLLFTDLGAAPVALPVGEIYSALDTNVIDAAEYSNVAENRDMGLFEVTKYFLNPSFHCPLAINDIAVNKDKWNELPPDLQAAFKMMTYELAQTLDYKGQAESFTAINDLTAKGIVHTQLPDSEMEKARAIAVENVKEWRGKSPMAAEMVDSILSYLKMRGVVE